MHLPARAALAALLILAPRPAPAQTVGGDTISDLRLRLTTGLSDQMLLLARAAAAALSGRSAEAEAARWAAEDEAGAVAAVLGQRLDPLNRTRLEERWRPHLAAQLAYAEARALPDPRPGQEAAGRMLRAGGDLGAFLETLGTGKPGERLTYRLQLQDIALKKGVDSLAHGNPGFWLRVIRALSSSGATLADPLAAQLALRPSSESRVTQALHIELSRILREHVHLALTATGAALGGRDIEFKAAANALDDNSVDLARAIGNVYGEEAKNQFLELWRTHIGFVVDYTFAVAQKDSTLQAAAVTNLTGYAVDFGQFLNQANPALRVETLRDLVLAHIVGLKGAIDAEAAGDWPVAYTRERQASAHMQVIADPLVAAIVGQFPERYGKR